MRESRSIDRTKFYSLLELLAKAFGFILGLWVWVNEVDATPRGTPLRSKEDTLAVDASTTAAAHRGEEDQTIPTTPNRQKTPRPPFDLSGPEDAGRGEAETSSPLVVRLTRSNTQLVQQLTAAERSLRDSKKLFEAIDTFLEKYVDETCSRMDLLDALDNIEAVATGDLGAGGLIKRLEALVDIYKPR